MVNGAHILLYSPDPAADRAFFRDVLKLPYVDDGGGWLIFALPEAEMGVHPTDGKTMVLAHGGEDAAQAALYLMREEVNAVLDTLKASGITCSPVVEAEWGRRTSIKLLSGAILGLYQPTHAKPPHA